MSNLKLDSWKIIQEGLNLKENKLYESLMSIGNGHMGMRGNFEEDFTGETLKGSYVAGVYYPDKTKVGWWKNGYPQYFAKVLNSTNYIGLNIELNGTVLDLNKLPVSDYRYELDMQNGLLVRSFVVSDNEGKKYEVLAKRFTSIKDIESAAVSYSIKPLDADTVIKVTSYLDGDVMNEDSNYEEKFWNELEKGFDGDIAFVKLQTKKLEFETATTLKTEILLDGAKQEIKGEEILKEKYAATSYSVNTAKEQTFTIIKYVSVTTSRDYDKSELISLSIEKTKAIASKGYELMESEQSNEWKKRWEHADIVIDGDVSAQQGIRFNIFQLYQTYTGHDSRLNIGPKGFTGEKYGGSTYWDTEAYCLPFYLSTADESIARNLLVYRYNHLEKAKENAKLLGLGGALYPMVTMNGEECHNEWEITFEEIHRNAAIAYAVYNYTTYTGDKSYLGEYGGEVVLEIARFWASRVNYVPQKDVYMMLGVTGPNEYDNNVNNNWYTNLMAQWTLGYSLEIIDYLNNNEKENHDKLISKTGFTADERAKFEDIIAKMYLPEDKDLEIFLQQDGYMDKEQILVKDLPKENLPLNQKWSWDRILRSCFIKQADVLQGMYFLGDKFTKEEKKRNFDFYEPRTVHESSLSPCVYSIIASEIGYEEKAYELYLRTARLDLDNYNNDTDDGLHITSMAGTWMSIVIGFGGMRIRENEIEFNPFIPKAWGKYSFKVMYKGRTLKVEVSHDSSSIALLEGEDLSIKVNGNMYDVKSGAVVTL